MSSTVYLKTSDGDYVYESNITHNLNTMADKAGIYNVIWNPKEIGAKNAEDIIEQLDKGLLKLIRNPSFFETFNSSNQWGVYRDLVIFVARYLEACRQYPNLLIEVSK